MTIIDGKADAGVTDADTHLVLGADGPGRAQHTARKCEGDDRNSEQIFHDEIPLNKGAKNRDTICACFECAPLMEAAGRG
jgi:hypothetical protein